MASTSRSRRYRTNPKKVIGAASLLAIKADAALKAGYPKEAHALYAEAASMTEAALTGRAGMGLDDSLLGLLISNAATLWYKANDLARAESLASRLLTRAPDSAKGSLRHVLFACWQAQTSIDSNESFTPIEMRLAGKEVGFGTAPVDEVSRRQETLQALLWRASEFEAGVPYRSRGLPHSNIRSVAQAYAATPVPGSYHVVLKVRSPWTQSDFYPDEVAPEARARGGEPLVHRAIRLVDQIAAGTADEIRDPLYKIGFSRLIRDLAPDGKKIEEVSLAGGTVRTVACIAQDARSRITEGIRRAFKAAGLIEIRGELAGMELKEQEIQIIVREGSDRRHLFAPRGEGFEERVGPLWGRPVLAAGQRDGSKYRLQDIEALDLESGDDTAS